MKMINKFNLILLLIANVTFSQSHDKNKIKADTIHREYDMSCYSKIAFDTISRLYNLQKELSKINPKDHYKGISNTYTLEELDLYSVPMFKIKKEANQYSLKKNIEEFIDFRQDCKFQEIYIFKGDTIIQHTEIPNFYMESLKLYDPLEEYEMDLMMMREKGLTSWFVYTNNYKEYPEVKKKFNGRFSIIKKDSDNFYFKVFGLPYELFEIDKKTGKLYISWIGFGNVDNLKGKERLPANEYIQKYIGEDVFKELARGYFNNIEHYAEYKESCKKYKKNDKQVILKFNKINN